MDGKFRNNRRGEPHDPDVLHDQGINPGAVEQAEIVCGILQFTRKDKRVQRDVRLDPVAVTERHDLRKLLLGEVVGTETCIEAWKSEEDGVGAVSDRRLQAFPSPRGR